MNIITDLIRPCIKAVGSFAAKHSTELLTGVGITSSVAAVAFSIQATVKTVREVDEIKKENNEEPVEKKEMAKIIAKNYWPVATLLLLTATSFGVAEKQNLKALATLNAAYLSERERGRIFKQKTAELIGKTKENQIYKETQREIDKDATNQQTTPILTSNGEIIFIDTLTGQEFKSSFSAVRSSIIKVKETIADCDFCTKNEMLYFLGINQVRDGDMWIWDRYDKPEIVFDPILVGADVTKYKIIYKTMPRLDYNK